MIDRFSMWMGEFELTEFEQELQTDMTFLCRALVEGDVQTLIKRVSH